MHAQVVDFITRMRAVVPEAFSKASYVVEAGSLDINGSPRQFFPNAEHYVGVDWRPGPGVDVVALFEKWWSPADGSFDFAISTEMMEHNPEWEKTIARMVELVKIGGHVLITCAGIDRPVHEQHTSPSEENGFQPTDPGLYYENRNVRELVNVLLRCARWACLIVEDQPGICDSRVFAIRKTEGTC